jgi:hypothetical protein
MIVVSGGPVHAVSNVTNGANTGLSDNCSFDRRRSGTVGFSLFMRGRVANQSEDREQSSAPINAFSVWGQ